MNKRFNFIKHTNQTIMKFSIKLGKTYYHQGFFNISKQNSDKFSSDKTTIELQLGDNPKNIIKGYINRTANRNATPRIMVLKPFKEPFKEWIHKNYNLNDILKVDILSNVKIKLNEKTKTTL